jgi:hypothetical protein
MLTANYENRNLYKAASTDTYRPALNGINILQDAMIVTNSYIIVKIKFDFSEYKDIIGDGKIIPVLAFKEWHQKRNKISNAMELTKDNIIIHDYYNQRKIYYSYIEGIFPNCDKFFEKKITDYNVGLSIQNLIVISKSIPYGASFVAFDYKEPNKELLLRHNNDNVQAVIMPVRTSSLI